MDRRGLLGMGLALPALAQGLWVPRGPLRFIVTFAPGGSADLLARRLAVPLAAQLGQPVLVENRPGAGGNIGIEAVARAAPDGLVFGMGAAGPIVINPAMPGAAMPYDAMRDLTAVIHLADQANMLVSSAAVPAAPLEAFRTWLRATPEEPFGSPGIGTSNHLTGLAMARALGGSMTHVPYRGSALAQTDMLSGQLRLMVDNIAGGPAAAARRPAAGSAGQHRAALDLAARGAGAGRAGRAGPGLLAGRVCAGGAAGSCPGAAQRGIRGGARQRRRGRLDARQRRRCGGRRARELRHLRRRRGAEMGGDHPGRTM